MNGAHYHLLINHFPILGTLFGLILLSIGLIRANHTLLQTALLTLFIASILVAPTNATGEQAEEIVEQYGVSHKIIHEHEEKAESALPFTMALGLLALLAYILDLRKVSWAKWLNFGVLALGIFAMYLLYQVGNSGGEIRHNEIRKDAKPTQKEAHEEHGEH
jgi:uncharacterized membrane protein